MEKGPKRKPYWERWRDGTGSSPSQQSPVAPKKKTGDVSHPGDDVALLGGGWSNIHHHHHHHHFRPLRIISCVIFAIQQKHGEKHTTNQQGKETHTRTTNVTTWPTHQPTPQTWHVTREEWKEACLVVWYWELYYPVILGDDFINNYKDPLLNNQDSMESIRNRFFSRGSRDTWKVKLWGSSF